MKPPNEHAFDRLGIAICALPMRRTECLEAAKGVRHQDHTLTRHRTFRHYADGTRHIDARGLSAAHRGAAEIAARCRLKATHPLLNILDPGRIFDMPAAAPA